MTLHCKGTLLDLSRPVVMGILNLTPDSFFDGGRFTDSDAILRQAETMLREGAAIIDLGGASSRPGAATPSEAEELRRLIPALEAILKNFPEVLLSVDTWRAAVAQQTLAAGAHILNDISAGKLDPTLFKILPALDAPYILMHMQGSPDTMQQNPRYDDVVTEVLDFFVEKVAVLRQLGQKDIVLDPGFGFGKTVAHNYALLRNLQLFGRVLNLPVLAGLSRKSMICKPLGITPDEALSGTSALHMAALQQGARILRAHDVREAMQVIKLWELLEGAPPHAQNFPSKNA